MTYSVHTRVSWEQKVSLGWESVFYPSLVKKIIKSDDYFQNLFEFSISPIKSIKNASDFFNLYDKEIASRKNYLFKQNEHKESLNSKIESGRNYLHGSLRKKDTGEYVGGVIFSIVENRLSFYLRAFNKESRSKYSASTTIDFWIEKEMYEYARSQNLSVILHGNDIYPNKGRSGLVLFKLKVGGRPKISKKEHEIINLTEEEIKQYDIPTFFWNRADEKGFFRTAHLFYKKGELNENVLAELVKVIEWANIDLKKTEVKS